MLIRLALALLFLAATPALAQVPAPVPPATAPAPLAVAPKPATVRVTMTTALGPIELELESERAPETSANFLRYVAGRKFDGATFYRAVKVPNAPAQGLVQGGLQNDPARLMKPIRHEPTSRTGILHKDGTISMARAAPGTATGDFFIILGDMPYMDANPATPGDNLGYAAFGHVVAGMDVVRQMLAAPVSPTKGEGALKGQMLEAPVRIVSVRRAAE